MAWLRSRRQPVAAARQRCYGGHAPEEAEVADRLDRLLFGGQHGVLRLCELAGGALAMVVGRAVVRAAIGSQDLAPRERARRDVRWLKTVDWGLAAALLADLGGLHF